MRATASMILGGAKLTHDFSFIVVSNSYFERTGSGAFLIVKIQNCNYLNNEATTFKLAKIYGTSFNKDTIGKWI